MTTATELSPPPADAPPCASAREYLRRGVPAVYREDGTGAPGEAFAMRFLEGLELVLDPVVAMLDLLPAHLDTRLAPPEVLTLVGRWLGLDLDPALSPDAHRRLVRDARDLMRERGTLAGVRRLLRLAFDHLDVEVRDGGGATWNTDPASTAASGEPSLTIVCPPSATAAERDAIRRLVAATTPAHVRLELLVEERERR